MGKEAGFSPARRIRKSHEYLALRKSGKKFHTAHFVLYTVRRPDDLSRLGLTVSRKVGGAVERNRVKRLLREFFRNNRQQFCPSQDISIVAKPGAAELSYQQVCEQLLARLRPAGRGEA